MRNAMENNEAGEMKCQNKKGCYFMQCSQGNISSKVASEQCAKGSAETSLQTSVETNRYLILPEKETANARVLCCVHVWNVSASARRPLWLRGRKQEKRIEKQQSSRTCKALQAFASYLIFILSDMSCHWGVLKTGTKI